MNYKFLSAGTLLLVILSGCASQKSAPDAVDTLNQRVSSIEGMAGLAWDQGKTTQNLIADLNRRVDALSGEVARLRDGQTSSQRTQDATTALMERLGQAERRLDQLSGQTRDALAQSAELRAAQAGLPAADRLEAAEQRLRQMEQQLGNVAARADAGAGLEARFSESANRVNALDARLARIEQRLEEAYIMARDALDATGMGQRRIVGKVVDSVTLTDDKTLFPINSPTLGEKDMAQLDALAARVKAMGTWFHLQIQGHTDGFGSEDYNYELGRARAEVVKAYLNEKGGIPLLRMSVISYGASEAASYAGKSNRRIVVHVLQ